MTDEELKEIEKRVETVQDSDDMDYVEYSALYDKVFQEDIPNLIRCIRKVVENE